MIVVDTNVIAYLFINGEYTTQAKELLKTDPEWIAPPLWKSEFRSVLALYMRQGFLSFENACLLLEKVEQFMSGSEFDANSSEVMRLVSTSSCSAYDCEFAALAKQLNLKLVTTDKKILSEFSDIALSLKHL